MEKQTYDRARHIQDQIEHISAKMAQVQKMRKRNNDEDFNTCRSLAYDSLNLAKTRLEKDFKEL